jgi:hypothetical protein
VLVPVVGLKSTHVDAVGAVVRDDQHKVRRELGIVPCAVATMPSLVGWRGAQRRP